MLKAVIDFAKVLKQELKDDQEAKKIKDNLHKRWSAREK